MTFVIRARARILRTVVLLAAVTSVAACEEDITDGLSTERPFTVYGYVNPTADTQYVRVFPITQTNLDLEAPEPIDAAVTFRNLASGDAFAARDSIVQFFSGRYGHVFWSPFRPEFEGQYAIEVRRSDGATSTATTQVPSELQTARGEPYTRFSLEKQGFVPYLPLDLTGQHMRLLRLTARYEVELLNVGRQVIELPYLAEASTTAQGWHVEFDMQEDFDRIFEALRELRERYGEETVDFVRLEVLPEVVNPEWNPPGGIFDRDLLVEPGSFDNVENGFGFFGSAYQPVIRYPVEPCLRLIVGYAESPLACGPEERCRYLEQCD